MDLEKCFIMEERSFKVRLTVGWQCVLMGYLCTQMEHFTEGRLKIQVRMERVFLCTGMGRWFIMERG